MNTYTSLVTYHQLLATDPQHHLAQELPDQSKGTDKEKI